MPRDLADVLHYFLPELPPDEAADAPAPPARPVREAHADFPRLEGREASIVRPDSTLPLQILAVPMGDRDVVRAALTWNLAVETARLGGRAIVLAPLADAASPLWPEPGEGPLGTELCFAPADGPDQLYRAAEELAAEHTRRTRKGGIVFVRLPSHWLESEGGQAPAQPFRWHLVLTSSGPRELREAFDLSKALLQSNPQAEIGVTIHGVRTIREARNAFERLHREGERQLGLSLFSYGLLVDDLHVYRAIAAQRAIGLEHPQAPATRALMDVAGLLYEDARSRVLG